MNRIGCSSKLPYFLGVPFAAGESPVPRSNNVFRVDWIECQLSPLFGRLAHVLRLFDFPSQWKPNRKQHRKINCEILCYFHIVILIKSPASVHFINEPSTRRAHWTSSTNVLGYCERLRINQNFDHSLLRVCLLLGRGRILLAQNRFLSDSVRMVFFFF